jgi:hypothetical protein
MIGRAGPTTTNRGRICLSPPDIRSAPQVMRCIQTDTTATLGIRRLVLPVRLQARRRTVVPVVPQVRTRPQESLLRAAKGGMERLPAVRAVMAAKAASMAPAATAGMEAMEEVTPTLRRVGMAATEGMDLKVLETVAMGVTPLARMEAEAQAATEGPAAMSLRLGSGFLKRVMEVMVGPEGMPTDRAMVGMAGMLDGEAMEHCL